MSISCGVNQENLSHWHWKEWPTENMDFFQGYGKFTKGKHIWVWLWSHSQGRAGAGSPAVTEGCWALMQIHPGQQLWLLMRVTWPKSQQTQNPPIRIVLTEAKGPSSSRSLLQLISIQSKGESQSRANKFLPNLTVPASTGKGLTVELIALVLLYWFLFHLYQVKLNIVIYHVSF